MGGDLQDFSVSPSPLDTNWVLELIWTWFWVGLGGFGTKGLGTGLDNFYSKIISYFKKLTKVQILHIFCQFL